MAVDELVRDLDDIDTEGEATLEDGMISCAALQIGMFALTLPENEREPYIDAAEYLMKVHSCLEQQLVPDYESEVKDGYAFVESESKAYRGKYEVREYSEEYVDMISGWYRTGDEKVTGGYSFCPLFLEDKVVYDIDNQGGCCDNDVHEIFKCVEETVFRKAFIYENDDGSFLTFGCEVEKQGGNLKVYINKNIKDISYNLKRKYTHIPIMNL